MHMASRLFIIIVQNNYVLILVQKFQITHHSSAFSPTVLMCIQLYQERLPRLRRGSVSFLNQVAWMQVKMTWLRLFFCIGNVVSPRSKRRKYKARKEAERRRRIRLLKLKQRPKLEDSDISYSDLRTVVSATRSSDWEAIIVDSVGSDSTEHNVEGCSNSVAHESCASPVASSDSTTGRAKSILCSVTSLCGMDASDEEAISRIEEIEHIPTNEGYSSSELSDSTVDEWVCKPAYPDSPGSLWDDFRTAALTTNMTTTQIDSVLGVLHKHLNVTGKLPKCEKTLCRTSKDSVCSEIRKVSGHDYYYFGLETQLKVHLALYPADKLQETDCLLLTWNNDGLPLFKSKGESSWPILVWIANLTPKKVFPVMISAGEGKPSDLHYLDEFTDELQHLMTCGINYGGKQFKVRMNAVVCDAPARAQIKNIMSFSGTYGCDQCESIGCHDSTRMTWPQNLNLKKRTDDRFRSKAQPEHHRSIHEETPLLKLDIDMINAFPPDFMHQGSGCMKKLLLWNVSGPKKAGNRRVMCRMSGQNVSKLNKRLCQMREFIPDTFTRRPRSTVEIPRYKAVELRQLQLYTGKVVFLGLMATDDHYRNICTYNAALALMVDERTARPYHELATYLIEQFAEGCLELYGNAFMVMNSHTAICIFEMSQNYMAA